MQGRSALPIAEIRRPVSRLTPGTRSSRPNQNRGFIRQVAAGGGQRNSVVLRDKRRQDFRELSGLGCEQDRARRVTVRHGPQGGRGGSSWTSAQAWVSRWPTAWARCKGNVIDEPTAPQNLELGQIDLAIKEEFCHRWPQGGEAHRGQAHEVRSARPPAAMPGMLLRKATVSALA